MKGSINRSIGTAFGAVYVLVGLLGFTVSGGHAAAGHEGGLLLGIFEVNVTHNVAHLLIGAAMILAARASVTASRVTNGVIGGAYLLLAALGPFIGGDHSLNILALNSADNVLHAASAVLLIGIAVAADRRARVEEPVRA
ncbi:DUF4383 domain-containing protein [Demequina lignilytica]|uniref:DUF4383 domain-containing protein n=1 Tax=Demequina lignilytica TaxID=3051663 RepID=A0AB35MHC3_9MICO|nr:DUF4383 domain-containing protein [Demequina sp. SYSU T0a273]MDN4483148.1 DUF4383 domain-containing protein [Demequina sp. SYSU T0a273]